ncbi:O-acetyl-ADP-ribose deacetylase [Pediococcus ethanolidurans]|uniref:O-acetyl-ADP-ribose deacetylase n=1 Tax=Pediococcus ethanolidurans TaxID=319653 RepID=UPI001C1EC854|nr:O-acetyl-ADP-ribose deacetylase [Pediococcus ethanolidurans]MBU7564208.1 O-acetyl-ADP-ribose deacetylase [Pediococcus ethanolidurans]MCV3315865.1 O-acetyl-ADP-ribose deacetylase [Pediococcus ethanolidurans]MCV3328124.1 O-acetyl-ADP-ribose deacetylase [Pediococcus ethanolidurans]
MAFDVIRGDITKMRVDAIVNAANTTLLGGGGVDGAIHQAAGPQLLAACRPLHGCQTGEAKITPGFKLPAKFVIHTPGPIWRGGTHHEAELLHNSYLNSLKLAEKNQCQSVAFPSISTGVYRFPLNEGAKIAVATILEFLKTATFVKDVTMVCFDEGTYEAYLMAIKAVE